MRNVNYKRLARSMGVPTSTNKERITYRTYGKPIKSDHFHRLTHQKQVYHHPTLPIIIVKTDKNQKMKIIDDIRIMELKPYYDKDCPYPKVSVDGQSKMIHRLVAEAYAGELIKDGWDCHHIDRQKDNYDFNNLIILPRKLHEEIHHIGKELEYLS